MRNRPESFGFIGECSRGPGFRPGSGHLDKVRLRDDQDLVGAFRTDNGPTLLFDFTQGRRRVDLAEGFIFPLEIEAGTGTNPESAIHADVEFDDDALRQAGFCSISLELVSVIAIQAILSAYPEIAGMVLHDAVDVEVSKAMGILADDVFLAQGGERQGKESSHEKEETPQLSNVLSCLRNQGLCLQPVEII